MVCCFDQEDLETLSIKTLEVKARKAEMSDVKGMDVSVARFNQILELASQ
jgi:hypothetical protein